MPKVTEEYRTARREQILDAALRCVAREGFHKTTMAQVIAESGLSAGAVYGYFTGKPDLIRAIASRALGGFAEALQEVTDGPGPVAPVDGVRVLVHHVEGLAVGTDGAFPRVALHAWSEAARDDDVREIVSGNIARVHRAWLALLERAEADGTVPAGDHDAMARALLSLLPGFVLQGLLLGEIDAATYVAGCEALLAG